MMAVDCSGNLGAVTSARHAGLNQLLQGLKLPAEGHQSGGLD
jgi:hypothetical protein